MNDEALTQKERKDYISMAKELCYSDNIIKRLMRAKTHSQASNIMHDGRNNCERRLEDGEKEEINSE